MQQFKLMIGNRNQGTFGFSYAVFDFSCSAFIKN